MILRWFLLDAVLFVQTNLFNQMRNSQDSGRGVEAQPTVSHPSLRGRLTNPAKRSRYFGNRYWKQSGLARSNRAASISRAFDFWLGKPHWLHLPCSGSFYCSDVTQPWARAAKPRLHPLKTPFPSSSLFHSPIFLPIALLLRLIKFIHHQLHLLLEIHKFSHADLCQDS